MACLIEKISEVRKRVKEFKDKGIKIGLVPTMGALHIGHESLLKRAKEECGAVIVSIFVNPIQFGPNEDFEKYPRQLEADLEKCSKLGVDVIFAPPPEEMYPTGRENLTTVVPPAAFQEKLCGRTRVGHFNGVATVVLKLFNIVTPDKAYFGQKDAQQLAIIKKMTADLNIPIEIVGCPIIRDADGLACSSRNVYLSPESREKALSLNCALKAVQTLYNSGVVSAEKLLLEAKKQFHRDIELEYLEIMDFGTLEPVDTVKNNTLIACAAKVDGVRLIDNIVIGAYTELRSKAVTKDCQLS
jgi:pantoate--beta-alanine ligase